ncbi:MAG: hypothetical protein GY861_27560 [bacterium]|nr:hypothetical protein [bacterium]
MDEAIDLRGELGNIDVLLDEAPVTDYFAAFVRNVNNPEQFRLEIMRVEPYFVDWDLKGEKKTTACAIIGVLNEEMMGEPTPVFTHEEMGQQLETFYLLKGKLLANPNKDIRQMCPVIGIAEYTGTRDLTQNQLASLVGWQYHLERLSYFRNHTN